jgi:hypothetical protein
MIQLWMVKV